MTWDNAVINNKYRYKIRSSWKFACMSRAHKTYDGFESFLTVLTIIYRTISRAIRLLKGHLICTKQKVNSIKNTVIIIIYTAITQQLHYNLLGRVVFAVSQFPAHYKDEYDYDENYS